METYRGYRLDSIEAPLSATEKVGQRWTRALPRDREPLDHTTRQFWDGETLLAQVLSSPIGAACSCGQSPHQGKCAHLLWIESWEQHGLVEEWPEGRPGTQWPWAPIQPDHR